VSNITGILRPLSSTSTCVRNTTAIQTTQINILLVRICSEIVAVKEDDTPHVGINFSNVLSTHTLHTYPDEQMIFGVYGPYLNLYQNYLYRVVKMMAVLQHFQRSDLTVSYPSWFVLGPRGQYSADTVPHYSRSQNTEG